MIVDKAESIVRPDTLEADALLDDIKAAKQEAQRAEERAKQRERQSQLIEKDLRYQTAEIEEARRAVIAETREMMRVELDNLREEIKQMRRQFARSGPFGDSAGGRGDAHGEFLARAEQELNRRQQAAEAVNREVVMPGDVDERLDGPIEVGDRVWVANLQASGEVLAMHMRTGEAEVQLGNFRLKLPIKRLELRQKAVREQQPDMSYANRGANVESPGIELDLRGVRVEEGLEQVEKYLDNAYMARLALGAHHPRQGHGRVARCHS